MKVLDQRTIVHLLILGDDGLSLRIRARTDYLVQGRLLGPCMPFILLAETQTDVVRHTPAAHCFPQGLGVLGRVMMLVSKQLEHQLAIVAARFASHPLVQVILEQTTIGVGDVQQINL